MKKGRLEELIKKYDYPNDLFDDLDNPINRFLDAHFGYKRIIIIKSQNMKRHNKKSIMDYCTNKHIDYHRIDGKTLTRKDIRGDFETTYIDGMPVSSQILPKYIQQKKQVILIENLPYDVDTDLLRNFMYMASLGIYVDSVDKLPKDKLPYGSSYIFIADDTFPYKAFESISDDWYDEAIIFNGNKYQERVKKHMIFYKNNILKIKENGEYKHNQGVREYGHLLPKDKQWKNIIPYKNFTERKGLVEESKLHYAFHHLNSSQAMCINFFYPLMKEKCLDIILTILGIDGEVNYDEVIFEKEATLYIGRGKSTNFDYFISTKEGKKIYFEVKYTENKFGQAKDNDQYQRIFKDIYGPILASHKAITSKYKKREIFLENYQILRNLIHIDEDSFVVFIYPKENMGIREGAQKAQNEIVASKWSNHFISITWEQMVEGVLINALGEEINEFYGKKFKEKYLNLLGININ